MTDKRMTNTRMARTRRGEGRVIAGVASGIADHLGWSRGLVRVAFLVFALVGVGEVVYIALWILMPKA